LVAVRVFVVLAIVVGLEKARFGEDSQRVTVPVLPAKVKVVEFVPVHTVAEPLTVPPTEVGLTVIWITLLVTEEQLDVLTLLL
jgi:hypothetical protein